MAVDLFAGAGGLSLGAEQAGFDVAAAVEYDPVHAAVHEYNFPNTVTVCSDVSRLRAEDLRAAVAEGVERHRNGSWDGDIDTIFGGPPCQGFSNIGKRLIDDKRNALVFHYFRLVQELRPRYAVMENVPGMTRGGHAGILERLISEFEAEGYHAILPYRVLNAADFGVPQDRKRLFLLLARDDQPLPAYPAPTVTAVPKRGGPLMMDSALPRGPSVWEAIADIPDLDKYESLNDSDSVRLSESVAAKRIASASDYARRMMGLDTDRSDLSYPRKNDVRLLTASARTAHTEMSVSRFQATPPGDTEPVSRFYRPHPDGLCNTLRAGSGSERGAFTSPRPLHPRLPRVISVREAARIHSFPDWFRFHETKWHGFRQIGNAVAPLVGKAVASEIVKALGIAPSKPRRPVEPGDAALLGLNMSEAAGRFHAEHDAIPATRIRGARPGIERAPELVSFAGAGANG